MAQASDDWAPGGSTRRAAKSASAFRTISEVAEDLDVPQHVLRFWETKFSQVKPLKRAGGRRYYRPEDVNLLRAIRDLLYREGYTIKGAQKFLREGGGRLQRAAAGAASRPGDGQRKPEVAPPVPQPEATAGSTTPGVSQAAAPSMSLDRHELKAIFEELLALSEFVRTRLG